MSRVSKTPSLPSGIRSWRNVDPTQLSRLSDDELVEFREYLMDIHSDARDARENSTGTMPHDTDTEPDETMREVLSVVRQVDDELYQRDMKSKQESASRVYVESRQDVPQDRVARKDEDNNVFYTLSDTPKEASLEVAEEMREEYPEDLEDETHQTSGSAEKSVQLQDNQERFVSAVVRSVEDAYSQRDLKSIIETERPSTWREVAESLVEKYTHAVDSSSPREVQEASVQRVVDTVLDRYKSSGGPSSWYEDFVMTDSQNYSGDNRGYPGTDEYRPMEVEGYSSKGAFTTHEDAQEILDDVGRDRALEMARENGATPETAQQIMRMSDHGVRGDWPGVREKIVDYLRARSRSGGGRFFASESVDPDEIEDPDDDGTEEFDIEGDPDEIEDPDDDGEEEMDVDPSLDDDKREKTPHYSGIGDPSRGSEVPHRRELEDKTTANLQRLFNFFARQYNDDVDSLEEDPVATDRFNTSRRRLQRVMRDIRDILSRRGESVPDTQLDRVKSYDEVGKVRGFDPITDMSDLLSRSEMYGMPDRKVHVYIKHLQEQYNRADDPQLRSAIAGTADTAMSIIGGKNTDQYDFEEKDDPCEAGYTMVGTKTDENGNTVPNCVDEDEVDNYDESKEEKLDVPFMGGHTNPLVEFSPGDKLTVYTSDGRVEGALDYIVDDYAFIDDPIAGRQKVPLSTIEDVERGIQEFEQRPLEMSTGAKAEWRPSSVRTIHDMRELTDEQLREYYHHLKDHEHILSNFDRNMEWLRIVADERPQMRLPEEEGTGELEEDGIPGVTVLTMSDGIDKYSEETIAHDSQGFEVVVRSIDEDESFRGNYQVLFGSTRGRSYLVDTYEYRSGAEDKAQQVADVLDVGYRRKSVDKQEPREGLEWSEKVQIVNIDEEENEVTLEDQLTGTEWTETVQDIEDKLEAINERDHGWLYDMIEGQYPEIDSSTAHEVLHEFDRLADDPSPEEIENMAKVAKVAGGIRSQIMDALTTHLRGAKPSAIDIVERGGEVVVDATKAVVSRIELREVYNALVDAGFNPEYGNGLELRVPDATGYEGHRAAEGYQRSYKAVEDVRFEKGSEAEEHLRSVAYGEIERMIDQPRFDVTMHDVEAALNRVMRLALPMLPKSDVGSPECPECGSSLLEKGECQVCGCSSTEKYGSPDPKDLTDEELDAAISQLESEVRMPGPSPTEELRRHREEARERGLFVGEQSEQIGVKKS